MSLHLQEGTLGIQGNLSYMWTSMVGHSLYLVKMEHKGRRICCKSTQAWKGNSL